MLFSKCSSEGLIREGPLWLIYENRNLRKCGSQGWGGGRSRQGYSFCIWLGLLTGSPLVGDAGLKRGTRNKLKSGRRNYNPPKQMTLLISSGISAAWRVCNKVQVLWQWQTMLSMVFFPPQFSQTVLQNPSKHRYIGSHFQLNATDQKEEPYLPALRSTQLSSKGGPVMGLPYSLDLNLHRFSDLKGL